MLGNAMEVASLGLQQLLTHWQRLCAFASTHGAAEATCCRIGPCPATKGFAVLGLKSAAFEAVKCA